MKKIVTAMLFALVLSACQKAQEVVLPTNVEQWSDENVQTAIKKLNEEDKKLLLGYATRASIGKVFGGAGIPPGTTIGDAINNQKSFIKDQEIAKAEADALKAKIESEREALRADFEKAIVVSVLKLRVKPKDYQSGRYSDAQEIELGFENKTEKDISGVAGTVRFYDMFGNEVSAMGFQNEDGIKARQHTVWSGIRDINQFNDKDKKLARLEEGKYTTRFEPEAIVFADGTKLTMPK